MHFYAEAHVDKFLRETFFPDTSYNGCIVEVGAGPPTFYSMSKHFRDMNWKFVGFDPNPKFVDQHRALGHEVHAYALANYQGESEFVIVDTGHWNENDEGISYSALSLRYECPHENQSILKVQVSTLDNMIEKYQIPHMDILTVDVEGWELEVMQGLDLNRYKPNVIVLENFTYKPEYTDYMLSRQYQLFHSIDHNFIYVPLT